MSYFALGADNSYLQRLDTLAADAPGKTRFVPNKGADASGHVDTENVDGTGHWEVRVYNATGGALVAGNWYHLTYDGDEETNPKVIAITDAANANLRMLGVAMEAAASATWTWLAFAGVVLVTGVEGTTDIAKDDFLRIDTDSTGGVTTAIKDGTAETDKSCAIACEAFTTNAVGTIRAILLGKRCAITSA